MATAINLPQRRTALDYDPGAFSQDPGGQPIFPPAPNDLIDDSQTSGIRTWSSFRIAAAIAAGSGGGGAGGNLYLATLDPASTANVIKLVVPGLTLSSSPVLIVFDPALNNTGATQVSVNGGAFIALKSRLNLALIGDELIAPVPALIKATDTTMKIVTGSI